MSCALQLTSNCFSAVIICAFVCLPFKIRPLPC